MLLVKGVCTFSGPGDAARDQPSSCVDLHAELGEGAVDQREVARGVPLRTTTSPPVMAPSARKVTISWKSSSKGKSPPLSSAPPSHRQPRRADALDVARPSSLMKAQNSCTCGSRRRVGQRRLPWAGAAHSTKFSVVVTEA